MSRPSEIERIISHLEAVREHLKMYFGNDDDPAIAHAYLNGTRFLALKIFDFRGSFTAFAADQTVKRRGYWYHADGVIPALKRKGLNDIEIVAELIESEIVFWKIYCEQLES